MLGKSRVDSYIEVVYSSFKFLINIRCLNSIVHKPFQRLAPQGVFGWGKAVFQLILPSKGCKGATRVAIFAKKVGVWWGKLL